MEADGLTNEQTEKVLQFQDLTGIEDMNICRDVLIRHQWDLEVAFQEQLNIREGRPSMYATSTEIRTPQVVNDRFLQQIFSANMPGGRSGRSIGPIPNTITGMFGYIINVVFQYCYSTISSIISTFFNFGRSNEQIVTDPLGDVMRFIESYNEKYPNHPVFYQGTYAQALNDAKQELRFLLVYLHKDPANSPDVDTFCSQTLADESVTEYINRNMLFWGCDSASPEGYRVSHSISARSYPIMVLIGLRTNKMIIMGRFEGDCTPEELLRRLRTVISGNDVWLSQARADRLERNFTQTLRQQQDEAYELSLRADEEKERRKQQEIDALNRAQEEQEFEKRENERMREEIAQQKIYLADRLPSEPPPDTPNTICVVFKLPNGTRLERRFRSNNSLKDVYNFLFCHPSSPDDFEITTNFPKRVLYTKSKLERSNNCSNNANDGSGSDSMTLGEVGLKNREVLFVNDLDA